MLRNRKTRLYKEETNDEEADSDKRGFDLMEQIKLNRSNDRDNKAKYLLELTGESLTLELVQKSGFDKPVLVKKSDGLDIKVPDKNFAVKDVRNHVGHDRIIDVMDVETQKNIEMSMKDFCKYYESKRKDRLLNVISLEFSNTDLDQFVKSPQIVRLLDWVDLVWPKFLKESQTESTNSIDKMKYPKVQKYCLMSVKGSYTDFHIDFGGTSVWYHILRGKKIFWMIPPTEFNLQTFEDWTLSGMQQHVFFGDTVEECFRVELSAGHTFFIPSGWIHAVYTLEDSLVFGGNFLHSYGIERQLKVASIEDVTKVPVKFRYPFYTEILWYVVQHYVQCLGCKDQQKDDKDKEETAEQAGKRDKQDSTSSNETCCYTWSNPKDDVEESKKVHLTKFEINGLKALVKHLSKLSRTKKSLPTSIRNSRTLLDDCRKLIAEHENDDPELAITGKPITDELLKSTRMDMNELIGQFFKQDESPTKETTKTSSISPSKKIATAGLSNPSNSAPTSNSTPPPRPKSPPTRPLSKNQYTNKTKTSASNNNNLLLPGSFADLIAATSTEKKVFDTSNSDSNAYLQAPLKKRLIESIPASQISSTPSPQHKQTHQVNNSHQDQLQQQEKERQELERRQEQQRRQQQDQQRHLEHLRRQQQERQRHQEQLRRQQLEQQRIQEQQRLKQEHQWLEQQRQQEKLRKEEEQRQREQQRLEQQRLEQQRLEKQRQQAEKQRLEKQRQLLEDEEREKESERQRQLELRSQQEEELERQKSKQNLQEQQKRQHEDEVLQRQQQEHVQRQHQQALQQLFQQSQQQQSLAAASAAAGLTSTPKQSFLISRPVLFNPMAGYTSAQLTRPTTLPLLTTSVASSLGLPTQHGARLVWATAPQHRFATPTSGVSLASQIAAANAVKFAIAARPTTTVPTNPKPTPLTTTSSQSKVSPSAIDNAALLSLATTALSTAPMMSSPALSQLSNRAAASPHAILVNSAATAHQQQAGAINTAALLAAGQPLFSPFLPQVPMATHYIARPSIPSVAGVPVSGGGAATTTATSVRPTMPQLVFARIPNQATNQQPRYLITQPHFMSQRFQTPIGIPSNNSQPAQTLAFATFKPTATSSAEPPKTLKTAKKVNTN